MAPRVVLVAGPSGSGKTCLLRRLRDGAAACLECARPTLGIDTTAGAYRITRDSLELTPHLAAMLPADGLDLELWEVGGREHREMPRGQQLDGLLLCYDTTDRTSFHLASHVLCVYRMDKHAEHALRVESVVKRAAVQQRLACVLCGNKAGDPSESKVSKDEVQAFVQAHSIQDAVVTCASTGAGVSAAFQALIVAMLQTEVSFQGERDSTAAAWGNASAEAWSLPCSLDRGVPVEHQSSGVVGPMTAPRGMRALEPPRGCRESPTQALPLVEVLGHGTAAPRTVQHCLEQGLQHRAVHVWMVAPRTGAVLLRKWSADALKHPGLWGPTCRGEVHCYGDGGDGHAAELSEQAACRLLREQLGVDATQMGQCEHWFSCTLTDNRCRELVDVQVIRVGAGAGPGGAGVDVPPLHLHKTEEVNWVFFGEVFNQKAIDVGMVIPMQEEYRSSMVRRLRLNTVREEVLLAFGDAVDVSAL